MWNSLSDGTIFQLSSKMFRFKKVSVLSAPVALQILLCILGTSDVSHGQHYKLAFSELQFPDGPLHGDGYRYLRIQEGAVIDINCKQWSGGTLLKDVHRFGTKWFLDEASYEVDPRVFPVKFNLEQYASQDIFDSPSNGLTNRVKPSTTIRYTARFEDHQLLLYCMPTDEIVSTSSLYSDSFSVSSWAGNYVELIIYPAPPPLKFRSEVVESWRGGFVGEINIPISEYFNAWKIILTFRSKVFSLEGGPFQIANEPCLHNRETCGDDAKNTYVIYHTFGNRLLNPGDHLKLNFVAHVWKKFSKGLKADIQFFGYKIYWSTGAWDWSSSAEPSE